MDKDDFPFKASIGERLAHIERIINKKLVQANDLSAEIAILSDERDRYKEMYKKYSERRTSDK